MKREQIIEILERFITESDDYPDCILKYNFSRVADDILALESEQTEKYKELIEWLNDECPAVCPPLEPYTTADLSHDFAEILRSKLDDLKNELGL